MSNSIPFGIDVFDNNKMQAFTKKSFTDKAKK